MDADYRFQSRVCSARKWVSLARYQHADNDQADTPRSFWGQARFPEERTVLVLAGFQRTAWGSSTQFLAANREQHDQLIP